ncbi:MAG TPA: creatininase family protein, partial [Armatimonadetes bacterium]|nr:creatininase family protein [Armatimonadota bacterium]
ELDTHVALLCEIAESLLHAGFTTFFFLNGHGGNQETMGLALRQLQADHPEGTFAGASYWDAALDALRSHLETQSYAGHAGEMETSLMLHLFPEQVRDDRLGKDGQWLPPVFAGVTLAWDVGERTDHGGLGDATAASAAKGQRLFAAIVNRLVEVIRALRAGEHLIS